MTKTTVRPGAEDKPQGMTMRDWFAGQALVGLISRHGHDRSLAEFAYSLADAMIAAREEQK